MCIRTGIKALALCSIPSLVGFAGGILSVEAPRVFAWVLLASLAVGGWGMLRCSSRAGCGLRAFEVEQVNVVAGVLLAIAFVFGLWTGLGAAAGFGILPAGLIVCGGCTALAAITLTFVRRLICGEVAWINRLLGHVMSTRPGSGPRPHGQ